MNTITPQEMYEFQANAKNGYGGPIRFNENIDPTSCKLFQLSTGRYIRYMIAENDDIIIHSVTELLCG